MPNLLEVTYKEIERLSDIQLTTLLSRLLHLEAKAFNIPAHCVGGSLKITIGDEGDDFNISWDGEPQNTNYIQSNNTLFQCKATKMGIKSCGNEILKKDGNLKQRVEEVLDLNGCYILFYYKALTTSKINDRIKNIRKTLELVGKDYAARCDIGLLDSGKLLKIKERKIAIHPMSQMLEEPEFKHKVANELGFANTVQFILRTGYVDCYPEPVSLRRPVAMFTDLC